MQTFSISLISCLLVIFLSYDLHMLNRDCLTVYKQIFDIGSKYGVKNAGYRAYNSLSLENGMLLINNLLNKVFKKKHTI